MTIEEIRANAPEGATHYDVDGDEIAYYMNDEGHWLGADDNGDWWNLFSGDFRYYDENLKPLH